MSFAREWAREFALLWWTVAKYAVALLGLFLGVFLLALYLATPLFIVSYIESGSVVIGLQEGSSTVYTAVLIVWFALNASAFLALLQVIGE